MTKNSLIWILAMMLLPLFGVAATANLSIEVFDIKAGETKEVVIDLTNPNDEITLVQFDLRLPDGLSLKQTSGEYDIEIAERTTWRKHSLDANAQADGTIRFLLASSSNATLSGTEGAIFKMTLMASSSFNGGDIKLENILMVSPDEQETIQATYTYTIGVTPSAPIGTATLSIEPFTIQKGGEAEMLIDVDNPDNEVTLVQFDLRLPAGLTLKQIDGKYDIDIAGRTTWRKHSLDANAQADGTIRFLMVSSSNTAIEGKSGAVIKMKLQASSSFDSGIVKLENALLVSPDETESKPDNYQYEVKSTTTITITAKNYSREYGDANPTVEYEVSGGTPTGIPTLTCSATKTSDVGTYEIVVGKGTLQGDVKLVNGTLTVTAAPLTASVGDYIREEGQENPTFVIAYSGWKNAENETVLTKKPVATTTATASSAPGTYSITVSGGEAKNYAFTYECGTLTVTEKKETPGTAKLSIEKFTISQNGETELKIDLTNPDDEITLVQFDLRLPDGLSLKKVNGEYDIDIAGRTTWRKHSLEAYTQADGTIRFLMASSSNATLSGTEGAIIKMTVVADNSFTGGVIKMENILMVTPEEKEVTQDAYTYSETHEPPAQGAAKLSIEEFIIKAGGETELKIDLNNPDDEITLVQFDLRLPDGLSLKKVDGEYDIDIAGRTTWKKHSLEANAQANGTIRFLMASNSNTTLSGTDGAIIKMILVANEDFDSGIVRLENILLVTPDEKEGKPDDAEIFVSGIICVMMDADNNVPIYSISGQRLTAPRKGINIVGGKKVIVR